MRQKEIALQMAQVVLASGFVAPGLEQPGYTAEQLVASAKVIEKYLKAKS